MNMKTWLLSQHSQNQCQISIFCQRWKSVTETCPNATVVAETFMKKVTHKNLMNLVEVERKNKTFFSYVYKTFLHTQGIYL